MKNIKGQRPEVSKTNDQRWKETEVVKKADCFYPGVCALEKYIDQNQTQI